MRTVLIAAVDGDLSYGSVTTQQEMPTVFHPEPSQMLDWRLTPSCAGSSKKLILADARNLRQAVK